MAELDPFTGKPRGEYFARVTADLITAVTPRALQLWCILRIDYGGYQHKAGKFWATYGELGEKLGCTPRRAMRVADELEAAGWLVIEHHGYYRRANHFRAAEDPEEAGKIRRLAAVRGDKNVMVGVTKMSGNLRESPQIIPVLSGKEPKIAITSATRFARAPSVPRSLNDLLNYSTFVVMPPRSPRPGGWRGFLQVWPGQGEVAEILRRSGRA